MDIKALREEIAGIIGIDINKPVKNPEYRILEETKEEGYTRQKIEYESSGDMVPAYLLIPEHTENPSAVLINHQHNSERHFGKSEAAGLVGSPYQAFGPVLAKNGFVVLIPDVICFEERRKFAHGLKPLEDDLDFWNHLNEMCYRILNGDFLMKNIL